MELSQIRYVLRVAELKNFSKAAQELSVSQPTLTQQISKLEAELGVTLFNRTTRSVSLTAAGTDFVSYSIRVIESLDSLNEVMRKHSTSFFDGLHIGIMPSISLFNLPGHISRYFSKNEKISLNISQAPSKELATELLESKLDVAFIDEAELDTRTSSLLDIRLLKREPIFLAMSTKNRFASEDIVNIYDLDGVSLCHLRSFEVVDTVIRRIFKTTGINYHIHKDFTSASSLFDELEKHSGVAFVPSSLCRTTNKNICFKRINVPAYCSLAIATQKNHLSRDVVKSFLEYVTSKIPANSKEGIHL